MERKLIFIKEETEMSKDFKDLRKAAFAVGFGFTVGKAVGGFVEAALDGVVIGLARRAAKNGNEFAQDVFRKAGVKIETEVKKDGSTVKMGFHPGGEA